MTDTSFVFSTAAVGLVLLAVAFAAGVICIRLIVAGLVAGWKDGRK